MHVRKSVRERRVSRPSSVRVVASERITVIDKLVSRTNDAAFCVPDQLGHGLTVYFVALSTKFGGDDSLASEVGRASELAIGIYDMVESERFAFWCVDRGDVREHVHGQVVDYLSRELGL